MKQIRQGDVMLVEIESLPSNVKPKNDILAYGEVTGHHHSFAGNKLVQVYEDETGNQFVKAEGKAILQHQEHQHLEIPKGIFKVIIQREYDILEGTRQVLD